MHALNLLSLKISLHSAPESFSNRKGKPERKRFFFAKKTQKTFAF